MNSIKRNLRKIFIQSLVWSFVYVFWALLRQFGQELVDQPTLGLIDGAMIYLPLGIITATTFVLADHFLYRRLSYFSFGAALLIRSFSYLTIFFALIVIGSVLYITAVEDNFQWSITFNYLFSKEGALLLIYFFFWLSLIQFILQIDRKFGPGNLMRMLRGDFYRPKEVERIVMFLDLKSSTTIAEEIGNIKFSRLIQDCFRELNIVKKYEAEIYQYVGDEAILIWEREKGVKNFNCIEFFFAYRERLNDKAEYYQKEYGLVPEFKCGCHTGEIIMTEIGQIKREIAYHGDVMNTASRIQGLCNELGKEYLLSKKLYRLFPKSTKYDFQQMDVVPLKGKINEVKIYGVKK